MLMHSITALVKSLSDSLAHPLAVQTQPIQHTLYGIRVQDVVPCLRTEELDQLVAFHTFESVFERFYPNVLLLGGRPHIRKYSL